MVIKTNPIKAFFVFSGMFILNSFPYTFSASYTIPAVFLMFFLFYDFSLRIWMECSICFYILYLVSFYFPPILSLLNSGFSNVINKSSYSSANDLFPISHQLNIQFFLCVSYRYI